MTRVPTAGTGRAAVEGRVSSIGQADVAAGGGVGVIGAVAAMQSAKCLPCKQELKAEVPHRSVSWLTSIPNAARSRDPTHAQLSAASSTSSTAGIIAWCACLYCVLACTSLHTPIYLKVTHTDTHRHTRTHCTILLGTDLGCTCVGGGGSRADRGLRVMHARYRWICASAASGPNLHDHVHLYDPASRQACSISKYRPQVPNAESCAKMDLVQAPGTQSRTHTHTHAHTHTQQQHGAKMASIHAFAMDIG
eukprot:1160117-Pelagomonas_calceolata.AAC.4